jgi:hypothetical protein
MKTSKVSLLVIGAVALLTFRVSAVEYVALTDAKTSVDLNPRDVVEVVGYVPTAGIWAFYATQDGVRRQFRQDVPVGSTFTSLSSIETLGLSVILKITRAHEINAVQPTSVLVIPENATGNYDIVVETSDDTSTWTPFHSQTVSAADAKRFFRTRIVKRD